MHFCTPRWSLVSSTDHADIYGGGAASVGFGEMIKDAGIRREDLIIQSKCAIVPGKMQRFLKGTHFVYRRRQLKAPWNGLS